MMAIHILLYLVCEQMVFRVKQLKKEWCKRARQSMKELCIEVKQLQLGVGRLLMEDVCIRVRQLQLEVLYQR